MPTSTPKSCPHCSGQRLYARSVNANGSDGPRLLKGLGRLFAPAKMLVVICEDCGHISFFAGPEERASLASTPGWMRIEKGMW